MKGRPMVKKSNNINQDSGKGSKAPQVFKISIHPINEHITTDGLLRKMRLCAAGCGFIIDSAERVETEDQGDQG